MTRATMSIEASISSSVVRRESEKRTTLFASVGGRPSERMAGEGASVPLEQALPTETAMPSRSSRASRASPERPSKRSADVFGRRGAPPPTTRARAKLLLLSSARRASLEWKALADVERSDALGAMKLVGRKAQQIHIPCLDIDRDPARGLNRVRVEEGAAPVNCGGQTGDREETAVLVVGGHDRDEERRRGERLLHARGIQSTGGLRVHDSRLDPLAA